MNVERITPGADDDAAEAEMRALLHTLATMATHAWRAQTVLLDPSLDEPRQGLDPAEVRRVARAVSAMLETAREAGLELVVRTGQPYDYGLPERVIASQESAGLTREQVVETIKPSIFRNGQMLQQGEVVIGVPARGPQ